MKTNKDYTYFYNGFGGVIVPAGTKLTHQTACGIDKNYHFVADLSWIKKNYPTIDRVLLHDATYYGIDVPKEYVDYEI